MGTDIHGRLQAKYQGSKGWSDLGEIENDRNYCVFSMLADVRNGFGFAGAKTYEPLVPISEPRGFPEDFDVVDDSVILESWGQPKIEYWMGNHSFSWLTVAEILAWEGWSKDLHMEGFISPSELERMQREGGDPKVWLAWFSGEGYKDYVKHHWTTPFIQRSRVFRAWLDYVALKHSSILERDPSSLRIVFGFDS
jgi:hypothetical protein